MVRGKDVFYLTPLLCHLYSENIFQETSLERTQKVSGENINNIKYTEDTVI